MMLPLLLALVAAHPETSAAPETVTRKIVIHQGKGSATHREVHVVGGENGSEPTVVAPGCDGARRFESESETVLADGKKNKSKIILCRKAGQSDAEFAKTLKSAAGRLATSQYMSETSRAKHVSALNAEAARLGGAR